MLRQVETLTEQLSAAHAKIAMWEQCMQQFLNCVMLSPDMNDMYKDECSALIQQAWSFEWSACARPPSCRACLAVEKMTKRNLPLQRSPDS